MLPKLVFYDCTYTTTSIFLIFSENRVLDSKFGVFGGFSIALKIGKSAITSVFQQIRPNKWYQQILREKIHLPGLFEIIFSPMGSNFRPKTVFLGWRDSGPKHIFGHYNSYIRYIEKILNPPELCIFCKEHNGSVYFTLSLEMININQHWITDQH